MSINEKTLANVTILKYNNAQSLNDFKAWTRGCFRHHSKFNFAKPTLFSVVRCCCTIVIRNCITVESNYKLADVARSSKIKFNFTFDLIFLFSLFPKSQ